MENKKGVKKGTKRGSYNTKVNKTEYKFGYKYTKEEKKDIDEILEYYKTKHKYTTSKAIMKIFEEIKNNNIEEFKEWHKKNRD